MNYNVFLIRRPFTALIIASMVVIAASRCFSDDSPDQWKAPSRAAKQKNPIPPDDNSKSAGKTIYATNCLACHGQTGKGDGPAAITCNPRPHDLSDPKIASQTDGALYWKITTGKKPMPTYEKLLSDSDRWNVVNYLRVLAPPPAGQQSQGDSQ